MHFLWIPMNPGRLLSLHYLGTKRFSYTCFYFSAWINKKMMKALFSSRSPLCCRSENEKLHSDFVMNFVWEQLADERRAKKQGKNARERERESKYETTSLFSFPLHFLQAYHEKKYKQHINYQTCLFFIWKKRESGTTYWSATALERIRTTSRMMGAVVGAERIAMSLRCHDDITLTTLNSTTG